MAHDHHHHHGESLREYFTEQLLTIFVVGLFGAVAVLMYTSGKLNYLLVKEFHRPVLIGGIAVLVLVAIRAMSVWREAGEAQARDHDDHDHHDHHHDHDHGHSHAHDHDHHHDHHHEHGPECEHDHHHHDHAHEHTHGHDHHDHAAEDHGHSHDLAWVFARMLVLFFPVALFIIGVPNSSFSQDWINKHVLGPEEQVSVNLGSVAQGAGTGMSFNDLNDAAYNDAKRETLQGQIGVLEGQYQRLGERQFTLYRLKVTCCKSDMVALKVRIITPRPLGAIQNGEWVRVKGEIRFVQRPGSTEYIPLVAVADMGDIKPIPPQE